MSLVNHLMASRTPLELAKDLAATAKENAALRQRAYELEIELFWLRVAERPTPPTGGILHQALMAQMTRDAAAGLRAIEAQEAKRHVRELGERAGTRRCTDKED